MGEFIPNVAGIESFLNGLSQTQQFKSNAGAILEKEASALAYDLAEECADDIERALSASGASGYMVAAVGRAYPGEPIKINNNRYEVPIYIESNSRPSLMPERYSGIEDMAALYNNGYLAAGSVWGVWHGNYIRSLEYRPATNFVQDGISIFNSKHNTGHIRAHAEINEDRFR